MKSDNQIAAMLYGDPAAAEKPTEEVNDPPKRRTDEELGDIVYPPVNSEYATEHGEHVDDVIRDVDGRKLAESDYHGDRASLAASIGDRLRFANLDGLDFTKQGASLAGSDLRSASLRGVKVDDLSMANITGASFDSSTDISNCNFNSTTMDEDTFQRLRGCKGFKTAKNLSRPRTR